MSHIVLCQNKMFYYLQYFVESQYEKFDDKAYGDTHFFYKCFIIPEKHITKEIIKMFDESAYMLVKFKFKLKLDSYIGIHSKPTIEFGITTPEIYEECKDKYKLIQVVNKAKKNINS